MKIFFVLLITVFIDFGALGQNNLLEGNVIGTLTATVSESESARTKMILDKSTITFDANHTFIATIMNGFSGTWEIKENAIILDSKDIPEPIILTHISKDNYQWDFKAMKAKINYIKNVKNGISEPLDLIQIKKEDLIGQWTLSQIEDIQKNKEENTSLFGNTNDDKLLLKQSGEFLLSKSANTTITGRIFKGTWNVDNGIINFKSESNEIEQLGITEFNADRLVIENMELRDVPMCGKTRIRYTHSRVNSSE